VLRICNMPRAFREMRRMEQLSLRSGSVSLKSTLCVCWRNLGRLHCNNTQKEAICFTAFASLERLDRVKHTRFTRSAVAFLIVAKSPGFGLCSARHGRLPTDCRLLEPSAASAIDA
jgi:hypothetical protein